MGQGGESIYNLALLIVNKTKVFQPDRPSEDGNNKSIKCKLLLYSMQKSYNL